jgi:hypothetical protein
MQIFRKMEGTHEYANKTNTTSYAIVIKLIKKLEAHRIRIALLANSPVIEKSCLGETFAESPTQRTWVDELFAENGGKSEVGVGRSTEPY